MYLREEVGEAARERKPSLGAQAFTAAAALDAYDCHLTDLRRRRGVAWSWRALARDLEDLRRSCAGVPELTAAALELSMAHERLLARSGGRRLAFERSRRELAMQQDCVRRLSALCRSLLHEAPRMRP